VGASAPQQLADRSLSRHQAGEASGQTSHRGHDPDHRSEGFLYELKAPGPHPPLRLRRPASRPAFSTATQGETQSNCVVSSRHSAAHGLRAPSNLDQPDHAPPGLFCQRCQTSPRLVGAEEFQPAVTVPCDRDRGEGAPSNRDTRPPYGHHAAAFSAHIRARRQTDPQVNEPPDTNDLQREPSQVTSGVELWAAGPDARTS
jgi:hypothetical protein